MKAHGFKSEFFYYYGRRIRISYNNQDINVRGPKPDIPYKQKHVESVILYCGCYKSIFDTIFINRYPCEKCGYLKPFMFIHAPRILIPRMDLWHTLMSNFQLIPSSRVREHQPLTSKSFGLLRSRQDVKRLFTHRATNCEY